MPKFYIFLSTFDPLDFSAKTGGSFNFFIYKSHIKFKNVVFFETITEKNKKLFEIYFTVLRKLNHKNKSYPNLSGRLLEETNAKKLSTTWNIRRPGKPYYFRLNKTNTFHLKNLSFNTRTRPQTITKNSSKRFQVCEQNYINYLFIKFRH